MPAASCRIIPARSIRRCDTISASFGFSLRMGRKNRDNRMGTLKESVGNGRPAVKPDRLRKHKGGPGKAAKMRISHGFAGDIEGANEARIGRTPRALTKTARLFRRGGRSNPSFGVTSATLSRHRWTHIFMPGCSGIFFISVL